MSEDLAADRWLRRRAGLARNWWALVIRGVIAVAFGLVAFFDPALTISTLELLFGAYILVDGIFAIIAAVRALAAQERWGLLLLEGVLGIGAGIAVFVIPGLAVVVFITLMAIWAVVTGALMVVAAFRLDAGHGNWLMGLAGLVSIVWGGLLLTWPDIGAVVLTLWLGAYALIFGIAMIALGLRLRSRCRGA